MEYKIYVSEDCNDSYVNTLFERLKSFDEGNDAVEFLDAKEMRRRIEKRSPVNYRYYEYSFILMLKGNKYVNQLKIVNALNLSIFPQLIGVYEYTDNDMIIVTKIHGHTSKKDIEWGNAWNVCNTPAAMKEIAVKDLKILEAAGYLLNPTFRFSVGVASDGRIIIPAFFLIKKEDASGILDDIYCRYRMFGWQSECKCTACQSSESSLPL